MNKEHKNHCGCVCHEGWVIHIYLPCDCVRGGGKIEDIKAPKEEIQYVSPRVQPPEEPIGNSNDGASGLEAIGGKEGWRERLRELVSSYGTASYLVSEENYPETVEDEAMKKIKDFVASELEAKDKEIDRAYERGKAEKENNNQIK